MVAPFGIGGTRGFYWLDHDLYEKRESNVFSIDSSAFGIGMEMEAAVSDDGKTVLGVATLGDPDEAYAAFPAPYNKNTRTDRVVNKLTKWAQYTEADAQTEDDPKTNLFYSGKVAAIEGNIASYTDYASAVNALGGELGVYVYNENMRNGKSFVAGPLTAWNFLCVPQQSTKKDQAMQFLNWLFENRDNHDLFELAIIGARLYYVIFQWSDYRGHPIDALKIWEGGLAIYGGVIAGLLTGIVWCRKKKIPFGAMADVCAPGLLIGQCIGRWGNFINREAFGRETTAFSRMGLTLPGRETVYVHPTFLYESLWNFVGFLLLHFWFRRHERKFDGELILLYAVWYGIGRALIEGLRTDSLYIAGTGIRVSQLLAGVSAAAAAVVLALFYTGKLRHPPRYVDRGAGGQPDA